MSGLVTATARWQFHGGLSLERHKDVALGSSPALLPIPDRLVVSLAQQQGAPAEPCVAAGDAVRRGVCLGRVGGDGLPIHAPAGGTVLAVDVREVIGAPHARAPCVEIATVVTPEEPPLPPLTDWQNRDPATLRERIHEAGIAGLGGAMFPTHRKLAAARDGTSGRILIVNGAECEPWIACDESLMRSAPERVVRGAALAARAAGADRIIIAVEAPLRDVAEALAAAARTLVGADSGALPAIVTVPARYPEGGERQLIRVLTGREVPSGGYPSDLGMLVLNVATIAAIDDAVLRGEPLTKRIVTVTGRGVRQPTNVIAPLGAPVSSLIALAGGYADGVRRLVAGGPMMGVALPHDGLPITRGTNCLLALTADEIAPTAPELPCIRCMACVPVCPAQLLPQQLHWHLRAGELDAALDHALFDCIECGCCAAVCPSHIPLVEDYRRGKTAIRTRDAERVRAERARRRFDARVERLDRMEAERREKLEARRARLADKRRRQAEIAASVARAKARRAGDDADDDAAPDENP